MPNPSISVPRWALDVIRLAQLVIAALIPFLPASDPVRAVVAVLAVVVPVLTVRQAVVPVENVVVANRPL